MSDKKHYSYITKEIFDTDFKIIICFLTAYSTIKNTYIQYKEKYAALS